MNLKQTNTRFCTHNFYTEIVSRPFITGNRIFLILSRTADSSCNERAWHNFSIKIIARGRMKVKRYKTARRILNLYKNSFRFREPFQVLCAWRHCHLPRIVCNFLFCAHTEKWMALSAKHHWKGRFTSRNSCLSILEELFSLVRFCAGALTLWCVGRREKWIFVWETDQLSPSHFLLIETTLCD